MYFFFYEDSGYESAPFATYEEAMEAWADVEADVACLFGYCDPDRLFLGECDESAF